MMNLTFGLFTEVSDSGLRALLFQAEIAYNAIFAHEC